MSVFQYVYRIEKITFQFQDTENNDEELEKSVHLLVFSCNF